MILGDAIGQKATSPGASTAVTHDGRLVAIKTFGRFTFDGTSPPVEIETIFDLASLTKVVATTSMAMILYERGLLDLEMPVVGILPEFRGDDPRRSAVTFRQLLAHSSGLPAYERLFLRANSRDELLQETFSVPIKNDPGTHAGNSGDV